MSDAPRILIAEDELPLLKALSLKLTSVGYQVDTATRGSECLEKLRTIHYDLLLLDIIMPDLNGFEILETMQRESIAVRTFVLSNLSQEEDFEKARRLGAEHYIVKAETPLSDVVAAVGESLGTEGRAG